MMLVTLIVSLCIALLCTSGSADYVGAVVEHSVFMGSSADSSSHKLQVNLDLYANLTALAKTKNVQILVFPEFGLIPAELTARENLYPYAEKIGEVNTVTPAVPCSDAYFSDKPIMREMSCAAKENKMNLLVNTIEWIDCSKVSDPNCPDDNHYQYNTDVVFNELGQFVTKYHKSHEFPSLQKAFDVVPQPSEVTFKSSFGVEFGLFICYDIMFEDPAKVLRSKGIEHFLYAVSMGKIGEQTVIETWSKSNDAVVLSANLGSGKDDCSGLINRGNVLKSEKVHLSNTPFPDENILVASVPV